MTDVTLDQMCDELNAAVVADAAAALWSPKATTAMATSELRSANPGRTAVGPAFTIRLSPARTIDPEARNKFFQAYEAVPAGSVVVIEVDGDVGGGVLGDVVAHFWKVVGVAGVVVDGPVRDVLAIKRLDLPTWSRSVTMRGMKTAEAVTVAGVQITCDHVLVSPGDLVVADDDGVFFLPAEHESEVLELAADMLRAEAATHRELDNNKTLLECYGTPAPATQD